MRVVTVNLEVDGLSPVERDTLAKLGGVSVLEVAAKEYVEWALSFLLGNLDGPAPKGILNAPTDGST